MSFIGDQTQSTTTAFGVDAVLGRKFTLTEAASATSMSIWNSTASKSFQMAVYADSAGAPGALVGSTNTGTTAGGSAFQTLNFASPLALTAADYWLCVQYGGSGTVTTGTHSTGANGILEYALSAYPTLPNPFGSPTPSTALLSIYLTYTPSSAYVDEVVNTLGAKLYLRLGEASGTAATDQAGNQDGVYHNTSGITYSQVGVSNDGNTGVVLGGYPGQGYITVADNAAQRLVDTWTVGCWLRRDDITDLQVLLAPNGATAGGVAIGLNADGSVYLAKDQTSPAIATSTTKLTDGLKHFVVITKSGSTVKIYFDRGVDVTGSVTNATIINTSQGWIIGNYNGASLYYGGFLDEFFTIPGTALSQGQVQTIYDLAFVYTAAPTPSVALGASSFSVAAGTTSLTASGGITYQWRRNQTTNLGTGASYSFVTNDRAQEIDVVATATSAAGFTTNQATPITLTPTAVNGSSWTRAVKQLLPGGIWWEPTVYVDVANSVFRLWCDVTGSDATNKGLWYFTCPIASDPTVQANWTNQGKVISGLIGSPTVIWDGSQFRLYYYNISATSALFTRTSADGVTWSGASTAIAANAVGFSLGWAGSYAWKEGSTWKMLVDSVIQSSPTHIYGLTYATSSDSGATYTVVNSDNYTNMSTAGTGVQGCSAGMLNLGQKMSDGYYYGFFHISPTNGSEYPTDIILAKSNDLTNLNGWTVLGHMLDHNTADQYISQQTADSWSIEYGSKLYLFHSGARTDNSGSTLIASYPGTASQFVGVSASTTKIPIDSFAYGSSVYRRDATYASTDAAVVAHPELFIDSGGTKTATTSFSYHDATLGRDRAIWAGDTVSTSDNAYIAAPGFFT